MIALRPMNVEEFPQYRDYFIVDYAEEIMANYGYSPEKSHSIAVDELKGDLPQTVDTPDHFLLCIEKDGKDTIGYLWYKLFDQDVTAFIYDFVIFAAFRGRGFGKASLTALQKQLVQSGVKQIKLRVAFDNNRAFGLYQKMGFRPTGINMIKNLEK